MSSSSSTLSLVPERRQNFWAGLVLVTLIAFLALMAGRALPLIGGPVFGILLGIIVRNVLAPGAAYEAGIRFAAKYVLQWSIVALGAGLSLSQVAHTGLDSLAVTSVTVTAAALAAWGLGRLLGVSGRLKLLIGVGTAICGGSAIAAVTPIVKPDDHETAFAISTIFLFNVAAVLLFPLLGHWLHLSDAGFGMWAGTAINDTSSVVAAGYSYSKAAGDFATIVKLTRATLIIPICLVLALVVAYREKKHGAGDFRLARVFPWFILWFLVASGLRTAGVIPAGWLPWIHQAAEFLIIVALAAIGLSSNLRRMAGTGVRPILLGLGVWVAVSLSSLAVQVVMGQM
ncbi:hypothetical protein PATSB16_16230 [Pandoraea thiooxydans]|uniref:Sulfate exporter family transporter n=1 Tax=Pandoraea thiooxydans TaxID=445709 RepID=A0A0G3ESV1_9BURK|nr:YeiH family protein [Pandoraea thiooxydans]AKJ67796.1 hypothetical protein ABW99_05745 [Pandoraea thiooxydans]APR94965.1 hypothetical protein PATSB16_16230 [Pandoraea thiooxydans]